LRQLVDMNDFGEDIRAIRLIRVPECNDYGTKASFPPTIETATELVSAEQLRNDAIARIEGKLDAVVEAVIALQRRIESMDAVMARIIANY